jgi:3-hydroxy-3-methylglutaryl CoA synthase
MELNGTETLNVGIKAIELYFPKYYIDQRDFAKVL